MSPVRFAIVGTGNIAGFHAEAIAQVPAARLVAAFSRNNPAPFAEKHACAAVTSLDELLARSDVDAVCITTPSGAHGDSAIAALRAGKHVLCEKPLEINPQRIDEMLHVAKESGRILAAVFQSRFGQGAQTLKRAIEAGRFGRLSLCSAYIKWWRTQEYYDSGAWRGTWELDGGGALMNQGIHAIDLLQWLVGLPETVKAFTSTVAHERIAVEDTAVAALHFPHGALGVIEGATSVFPGWTKRIEISGDRGSAILEDDAIKFWQFDREEPEDAGIRTGHQAANIGGGVANPMAISTEGHRRQIEDLCAAIQENRPPAIAGADARHAVALICAIYESARTGQPCRVGEI
jgi:UDP-N-acetyl-2-amino-2-deoxyglucuronate dehydrogenase